MPVLTELLTTTEAAEYLGVSAQTVRNWARAGYFPYIQLPSKRRLLPASRTSAPVTRPKVGA